MDDYKNYIVPAVALLLLLAWFFVIQPRLTGDSTTAEPTKQPASTPAPQ